MKTPEGFKIRWEGIHAKRRMVKIARQEGSPEPGTQGCFGSPPENSTYLGREGEAYKGVPEDGRYWF